MSKETKVKPEATLSEVIQETGPGMIATHIEEADTKEDKGPLPMPYVDVSSLHIFAILLPTHNIFDNEAMATLARRSREIAIIFNETH